MTYTELESRVFNIVLIMSYDGCGAEVHEIAQALDVSMSTAKGAVGSLVKKGKVMTEERELDGDRIGSFKTIHEVTPIFKDRPDWCGTYGCDVTSFAEWMSYRLNVLG